MREFHEETGIDSTKYKILPNFYKLINYVDDGINYKIIYYLAFTKFMFEPKPVMKNTDQISEVEDMKWLTLDEIKMVDYKNDIAVSD